MECESGMKRRPGSRGHSMVICNEWMKGENTVLMNEVLGRRTVTY